MTARAKTPSADAKASLVGFMVNANAIGKAMVPGMYGRSKP